MSATKIQVSTERLFREKSYCLQEAANVEELRGKLQAVYQADGHWVGPSSAAFEELWFKMSSGFNELNNAFETLATFLGESAVRYEQTEEKIRQGLEK